MKKWGFRIYDDKTDTWAYSDGSGRVTGYYKWALENGVILLDLIRSMKHGTREGGS